MDGWKKKKEELEIKKKGEEICLKNFFIFSKIQNYFEKVSKNHNFFLKSPAFFQHNTILLQTPVYSFVTFLSFVL